MADLAEHGAVHPTDDSKHDESEELDRRDVTVIAHFKQDEPVMPTESAKGDVGRCGANQRSPCAQWRKEIRSLFPDIPENQCVLIRTARA